MFWTWAVYLATEKSNISIRVKEGGVSNDGEDDIAAHIR